MEYAADDAAAIKARMAEIARDEAPTMSRIDRLYSADLDAVGALAGVPRNAAETDYDYRKRLKTAVGMV